jgi:hypothetical protein
MKFWADGQQPFPYRVMEELLVIREQRLKTATIACEAPPLVQSDKWSSACLRSALGHRNYSSFAYSAFACFRMGMSASASFQSVRKS